MIITKLIGGLGNQMFQYAMARGLAILNQTDLKLDVRDLHENLQIATPRTYALDVFNLDTCFATADEIAELTGSSHSFLAKLRGRAGFPAKNAIFDEKQFRFDPDVLNLTGDLYLRGYWQSEKYFSDIETELRKDFTFRHVPNDANEQLLRDIRTSNSVSLHVRRGDYVSDKHTNQYHGVCPISYYRQALILLTAHIGNPKLFVFTDDPEWAKCNLPFNNEMTIVEGNEGEQSYEDMRLMSMCQHNIIANSSFSWWGAWLNQRVDKMVIAPKQWFRDNTIDTTDLIPAGWIRL